MSRSSYKRRSNRSAKILTTIFSIIIVISFVLSLIGPEVFQGSSEPTSVPTPVFVTPTPSPTPTAGVPTPVVVTLTPVP